MSSGVQVVAGTRAPGVARWARVSGAVGVAANVALIGFFGLSEPYGLGLPGFSWVGPVNDALVAAQFAALVPVVAGLSEGVGRIVVIVAAGWVSALQAALALGMLSFERQILLVYPGFEVVFGWVLLASAAGHRRRSLPRPVTRLGLLLGGAWFIGQVLAGAGYLLPADSLFRTVLLGAGIVGGSLGWLALPVWFLMLARGSRRTAEKVSQRTSGIDIVRDTD